MGENECPKISNENMYQTYLRKANPDIQLRMQLFVNVQTKSKGGTYV